MRRNEAKIWIEFADRDLHRSTSNALLGDYDLAAYLVQQTCEKALKAVLIRFGEKPPKTHNIRFLIGEIEKFVDFPPHLMEVAKLSQYAFSVRYPDDYVPVGKEEYEEAYEIAKRVLEWAKEIVRP